MFPDNATAPHRHHAPPCSFLTAALVALSHVACTQPSDVLDDSQPWLTTVEELRMGNTAPESEITRISALTVDASGSIYASDPARMHILKFSPSGHFERTIGRGGQGPGEFQDLTYIGFTGDTLWGSDWRAGRISFFSTDGTLLRTERTAAPPSSTPAAAPLAVSPEGYSIVVPQISATSASDEKVVIPVLRYSREGSDVPDTIARIDASNSVTRWRLASRVMLVLSNPFANIPVRGFDPATGRFAIVTQRTTDGDVDVEGINVEMFDPRAGLQWSKQIPLSATPVSAGMRDSVYSSLVRDVVDQFPSRDDALRSAREAVPPTEYLPAIIRVVMGSDSTVWLQLRPRGGHDQEWIVLDKGGEVIGKVRLPREVRIATATRGNIWGTVPDADGVTFLVRLRVAEL
jgi:hypothetical protein